jgi:hypothetical protein
VSKREILAELPKLGIADRREIFDRICEMEESDALEGVVTPGEKALLDRELEEYHRDPKAESVNPPAHELARYHPAINRLL